jgi:hypothetical protein
VTPEVAIGDVTQALRDILAYLQASGVAFPEASTIANILQSEKLAKGESTMFIPVVLDSGRSVRANLAMGAGLLEAIDTAVSRAEVTRWSMNNFNRTQTVVIPTKVAIECTYIFENLNLSPIALICLNQVSDFNN